MKLMYKISPIIMMLYSLAICGCTQNNVEDTLLDTNQIELTNVYHYADGGSVGFEFEAGIFRSFVLMAHHQDELMGGTVGYQEFFIYSEAHFKTMFEIKEKSVYDTKLKELIQHADCRKKADLKWLPWLKKRITNRKTKWADI